MSDKVIDIKDAIRVEKYYPPGKNGGPKNQYIFKCSTLNCDNEFKIKARTRLKTATGLCIKCNNKRMHESALEKRRLKPFEAMFNRLKDSAIKRNVLINLSYDNFLLFTTIHRCHYCYKTINWSPYSQAAYNLDRKDNKIGYSSTNCVVCCFKCNKGKRELYSYRDWYGMTEYFRKNLTFINK